MCWRRSSVGGLLSLTVLLIAGYGWAQGDPPTLVDADTALLRAAAAGDADATIVALASSANPNVTDDRGFTPLMVAAIRGYREVTAVLLAGDADPNLATLEGATPLMGAAVMGHLEIAKLLVDAGANVSARNVAGASAKVKAEEYGHTELAEYLASQEERRPLASAAPAQSSAEPAPEAPALAPARQAAAQAKPAPAALPQQTPIREPAEPQTSSSAIAEARQAPPQTPRAKPRAPQVAPRTPRPKPQAQQTAAQQTPARQPASVSGEGRESAPGVAGAPPTAPEPSFEVEPLDREYVLARGVNLRQRPDAKSSRTGSISEGSRVRVTGKVSGSNWYRVGTGPSSRYIVGSVLISPDELTPEPPARAPEPLAPEPIEDAAEPAPTQPEPVADAPEASAAAPVASAPGPSAPVRTESTPEPPAPAPVAGATEPPSPAPVASATEPPSPAPVASAPEPLAAEPIASTTEAPAEASAAEAPPVTAAPGSASADIEPFSARYIAPAGAVLREAPAPLARISGRLVPGAAVLVTGRVRGSPWYQVEVGKRGPAYVSSSELVTEHALGVGDTDLAGALVGATPPVSAGPGAADPAAAPVVQAAQTVQVNPEPAPERSEIAARFERDPAPAAQRVLSSRMQAYLSGRWGAEPTGRACAWDYLEVDAYANRITLTRKREGDRARLVERAPVLRYDGHELELGTLDQTWRLVPDGERLHYSFAGLDEIVFYRCP